jgi:anthranilate phosphoribosyltransferase
MSADEVAACLSRLHIGFCFAPNFHPALAQLREVRKRLGIPTVFNLVGPLLNPCRPQHYVLGVFSTQLLQPFADLLSALNVKKSVVVCADGMDEISCSSITHAIEVDQGRQVAYEIDPRHFGMQIHSSNALQGGEAVNNAALLTQALAGKSGAIADALVLNAAMAIYLYGICNDLRDGITIARQHLLDGSALQLLERWRECGNA